MLNELVTIIYEHVVKAQDIQRFDVILILIIIVLICIIGICQLLYKSKHTSMNQPLTMIIHNHGKKWW